MEFEFQCSACGEVHKGMPSFGSDKPFSYYEVLPSEREVRCQSGTDDCVIDEKLFFIRGCIEIPVIGEQEPFQWGVWVSLSKQSFEQWLLFYDTDERSHIGPFFGWLNAWLKPYPNTINLKTKVHLRDNGIRPFIELEPNNHPLAIDQREGITKERVAELYSVMMHQPNSY